MSAVTAFAAAQRAESLYGAAVQLFVMRGVIDELVELIEGDEARHKGSCIVARLEVVLYSIRRIMASAAGGGRRR